MKITSVMAASLLAGVLLASAPARAEELATPATHVLLVDAATGAVLLEKEADARMAPASMSKLMTVYMLFDRLKRGELSLDDTFSVSEKAWRKGGSKMFVRVGDRVKVEDLIRGIVVQSGNDATIVVAEALGGSEAAFAEEMSRRAAEIGLTDSQFANASGWPDPKHYMTPRDLSVLARRLIEDFPEFYPYYSEKSFTYNGIRQGNRNPLLYRKMGADGLKTGHIAAAGYGLTASVKRGERRLVLVVHGLESVKARATEAERLLEWGFRTYRNYRLFSVGDKVGQAEVWLGDNAKVPLMLQRDLVISMKRGSRPGMKAKVVYEGPVAAPIAAGTPIAKLVVTAPDFETLEVPLVAGEAVEQLGVIRRVGSALHFLIFGASG